MLAMPDKAAQLFLILARVPLGCQAFGAMTALLVILFLLFRCPRPFYASLCRVIPLLSACHTWPFWISTQVSQPSP